MYFLVNFFDLDIGYVQQTSISLRCDHTKTNAPD
ncbi:hypothetical protein Leryth_027372, partial [Lithospermum erythrorhizon]